MLIHNYALKFMYLGSDTVSRVTINLSRPWV